MILGFPELIRLLVLVLFLVSFDFTHRKKKRVQFNTKVNEIFCASQFLLDIFFLSLPDALLFFMGHHPFVTHGPSPVVRNESNHVVLYICSHVPRRVERKTVVVDSSQRTCQIDNESLMTAIRLPLAVRTTHTAQRENIINLLKKKIRKRNNNPPGGTDWSVTRPRIVKFLFFFSFSTRRMKEMKKPKKIERESNNNKKQNICAQRVERKCVYSLAFKTAFLVGFSFYHQTPPFFV